IDAEPERGLDCLVEVALRQRLHEVERLLRRVQPLAVELARGVDVLLAVTAHESLTSMPAERAVPSACLIAPSGSIAFRPGMLVSAICRTCSRVTEPTFSMRAFGDPFSSPAACFKRNVVGGVFVMNVNERSSKIEISAGMIIPRCDSVWALYALQKSMMLMPCGPRAGPTRGGGGARPRRGRGSAAPAPP